MLVTLPLVLLLLDYWPLGRFAVRPGRRATSPDGNEGAFVGRANFLEAVLGWFPFPWPLVIEKIPMFLLAGAFCAVTAWLQGGVIPTNMVRPFWERIANALFAYVAYLGQLFYPRGLAVFYPHWEVNLPVWTVVGASSLVLACISAGALASWRRYPYLLIGWLWYVGMLVPVIGLVQIGGQAMADRYTYLPQIGLCIALVWFAADVCRAWPYRRWVCGMASALVLALLMGCAWRQTSFWSCSETLWTHALACTSRNHVAHSLLGTALADRGQFDGAIAQYQEALKIKPNFDSAHLALGGALAGRGQIDEAMAHYRKVLETHPDNAEAHIALANALAGRGQIDEAIAHYRKVLEIQPAHADAHYNLAVLLAGCGRFDEAIAQYRQSLEINPDSAFDVHSNLGIVLAAQGRFDEAVAQYGTALEMQPNHADTRCNLGNVLERMGRPAEAMTQYRQSLKLQPDNLEALKNLAWLRATCPRASLRNGAEAIELAQRANQLSRGKRSDVLDTLAAAYAEAGWFPEALAAARKALQLATPQDAPTFQDALRGRITLYEAGKPFHQTTTEP
jgi:tetratricopeptide (TPR) repeat protein